MAWSILFFAARAGQSMWRILTVEWRKSDNRSQTFNPIIFSIRTGLSFFYAVCPTARTSLPSIVGPRAAVRASPLIPCVIPKG